MGLFDTVYVLMKCPYCNEWGSMEAQTKDLGKVMSTYHSLSQAWMGKHSEKKMRTNLPTFPRFPLDKAHAVWKNQAERTEAEATVPTKFQKLKYIDVTVDCHSIQCQFDADRRDILQQGTPSGFGRMFHGRIKIKNKKLVGEVYCIKKDDLTEKKLSTYKYLKKHKQLFKELKKKYKHEPIICRKWREIK